MMLSAMQKYAASHFLSLQQSFVEGAMIYYHCFIDVITCSELHSYHVAGPKFEPMFVWLCKPWNKTFDPSQLTKTLLCRLSHLTIETNIF